MATKCSLILFLLPLACWTVPGVGGSVDDPTAGTTAEPFTDSGIIMCPGIIISGVGCNVCDTHIRGGDQNVCERCLVYPNRCDQRGGWYDGWGEPCTVPYPSCLDRGGSYRVFYFDVNGDDISDCNERTPPASGWECPTASPTESGDSLYPTGYPTASPTASPTAYPTPSPTLPPRSAYVEQTGATQHLPRAL
jgi:hypothetical protein